MKNIASLFLLFAFASVGIGANNAPQSQEEDIREAVFRWQFDHNVSGQQNKAKGYFLTVGEKSGDPSDKFIKRFAHNKPPVRKRSECSADPGRGVLDKKTGERGLIFFVTSIKWNSDTEVEVKGGYYEAGMSASGNTYALKKEKGKWKVTNDTLDEIS
ncbi:MAG TPA: hypothetical protein VG146_07975 [Verrucomicrobiae bacterium]|nr:hypothetical protein [Verrucomicrobiae bacterium]